MDLERLERMAYETLIVEIEDHVALIKLNRPDAMNALDTAMIGELCDAIAACDANDKARCIVLTGSDKVFSSGADIAELAGKSFTDMFCADRAAALGRAVRDCRTPIVAAVAGYALGGGCELALMCDIVIAADTAKFGQPDINLGVIASMGGTQRLTHAVGKAKAMDMHLTGRFMLADEAERSGLVSRVVPAKKLLEEARAAAQKIADRSRISAMAAKEAVNRSFESPLAEGLLFERRLYHALFATADSAEGMAAFLEKRDPQFRDK